MNSTLSRTDLSQRFELGPPAIWVFATSLLCGASWAALVVSIQMGRTTPTTASLGWLLAFAAAVSGVCALAGLPWWALVRWCGVAPATSALRVGAICFPLLLAAPLLVGIYRSDPLFHYMVNNPIPRALATWVPLGLTILLLEANLLFSSRLPARLDSWLRRERSTPILLFVAFAILYVFTAGGHLYSPDERQSYQVTAAMAEGTFPLTHEAAAAAPDAVGRLYSKYGLVPSVLGLPPYLLSQALGLEPDQPSAAFPIPNGAYPLVDLLVNPLVTALTVVLLYCLARVLAFGKTSSVLIASIYGASTSSWVYSKTLFSQPPATLFLLGATFFALRRGRNPVRDFAFSGAFLGLAAGSRVEVLLIALPLVVCLVRTVWMDRDSGVKSILAFALALAAFAGVTAGWYNYVKTGFVFSTGHGQQGTLSGFSPKPYIGLFGSLFSSGFGFVTYNPVVAVGAVGFPLLALKHRFEARLVGSMVAIGILLYGSFGDWSGGFTWANRYLVVILPFAVLPAAVFLERQWRGPTGILLVAGASLLGFAINLLAVLFDFNNGWLDLWDHRAGLLQIQWDAHFSPIGAHVRLLGNFLATGAKLDLYLFYKLGLPALIVFGLLLSFVVAMLFRSAQALPAFQPDNPDDELATASHRLEPSS